MSVPNSQSFGLAKTFFWDFLEDLTGNLSHLFGNPIFCSSNFRCHMSGPLPVWHQEQISQKTIFHRLNVGRGVVSGRLRCSYIYRALYCSVAMLCSTLWPHGLHHAIPVPHCLQELAKTHVHGVGDAIQPSHPLSSPSLPTYNLSQHQGLFQGVSSLHQVAKVLEFQLQHQSFQWTPRTDLL